MSSRQSRSLIGHRPRGRTTLCRANRKGRPETGTVIITFDLTTSNDRDTDLDAEHEGDPLVVGGVGGLVRALDSLLLHYTPEVGLVLWWDVGTAVYPAVVLGHLGADALELATGKKICDYSVQFVLADELAIAINLFMFRQPDGVPKVLASYPHCGSRHADHHRHLVVHLEHPVVDVDLIKGEIFHQVTQ